MQESMPMNAMSAHPYLKLSLLPARSVYLARKGLVIDGILEVRCEKSNAIWLGEIAIELKGIEELRSLDHSSTRIFHSRTILFQGHGLPPSNAVKPTAPIGGHYYPGLKGRTRFQFQFPIPSGFLAPSEDPEDTEEEYYGPPGTFTLGGNANIRWELRTSCQVLTGVKMGPDGLPLGMDGKGGERSLVTKRSEVFVVEDWGWEKGQRHGEWSKGRHWKPVEGRDLKGPRGEQVEIRVKLARSIFWRHPGREKNGEESASSGDVGHHGKVDAIVQVRNGGRKTVSGLAMSFARRLLLPRSESNAPPPQITEVVLSHPFRGSAFEFPPSREWKEVHLSLELPRIGARLKSGALDGELWTVKGGRLFEIACVVGVELGGGMFDKKLLVEVPVTILHPLSVPPEGHHYDPNPALSSDQLQQPMYSQDSYTSMNSYQSGLTPNSTDFSPAGPQHFQIPQPSVNYGSHPSPRGFTASPAPLIQPVYSPGLEPPQPAYAYQNNGSYSPTLPPTSPGPVGPSVYSYLPPSSPQPYLPPTSPQPYPPSSSPQAYNSSTTQYNPPYQPPTSPQSYNNYNAYAPPQSTQSVQPQYIAFDPSMPDLTHSKLVNALNHQQNIVPNNYSQPLPIPGTIEPLPPPMTMSNVQRSNLSNPPIPPPRPTSRQSRQGSMPPMPPPQTLSNESSQLIASNSSNQLSKGPQQIVIPAVGTGHPKSPTEAIVAASQRRERQADTPEEVRRVLAERDRRNSVGTLDLSILPKESTPSPQPSPEEDTKSLPPASYFQQAAPVSPERPSSRNSRYRASTTPPPAPSRFSPLVQQSVMGRPADVGLETIGEDGESQAGTMRSKKIAPEWIEKQSEGHIVQKKPSLQALEDMVLNEEKKTESKMAREHVETSKRRSETPKSTNKSDVGLMSLQNRLTRAQSPAPAPPSPPPKQSTNRPLEPPSDFGPVRPNSPARVGGAGALRAKSFSTAATGSFNSSMEQAASVDPVGNMKDSLHHNPTVVQHQESLTEEYKDGRKVLDAKVQTKLKDQAVDRVATWLRTADVVAPPPDRDNRASIDNRSTATNELYSVAPKVVPISPNSRSRSASTSAPRQSMPRSSVADKQPVVNKIPLAALTPKKPDILSIQRSISPQPQKSTTKLPTVGIPNTAEEVFNFANVSTSASLPDTQHTVQPERIVRDLDSEKAVHTFPEGTTPSVGPHSTVAPLVSSTIAKIPAQPVQTKSIPISPVRELPFEPKASKAPPSPVHSGINSATRPRYNSTTVLPSPTVNKTMSLQSVSPHAITPLASRASFDSPVNRASFQQSRSSAHESFDFRTKASPEKPSTASSRKSSDLPVQSIQPSFGISVNSALRSSSDLPAKKLASQVRGSLESPTNSKSTAFNDVSIKASTASKVGSQTPTKTTTIRNSFEMTSPINSKQVLTVRESLDLTPKGKNGLEGLMKPTAIRPSSPGNKPSSHTDGFKPKYDVRSARGGRGGVVTAVAGMWAQMIEENDGREDGIKPKTVNDFLKAVPSPAPKNDRRISLQQMHHIISTEKPIEVSATSRGVPARLKRFSAPASPPNPNKSPASPPYLNTAPSAGLMSHSSSSTGSDTSSSRPPSTSTTNPKLQNLIKKYTAAAEGTR